MINSVSESCLQPLLEPADDSTDSDSSLSEIECQPLKKGTTHSLKKRTAGPSSSLPAKASKLSSLPLLKRTYTGPCPICSKDLKTNLAFSRHMRACHLRNQYKCDICTHCERFPTEIAEHMLSQHPGRECIRCNRCKQTVTFGNNPKQFEEHVR